ALHVDDEVDAVLWIDGFQCFVDAVRSREVIAPRHDGTAAGFFHSGCNRLGIGRDNDFADVGGLGAPQDLPDHRLAMQVSKRLRGQTGGGEARRDKNNCVWHRVCRKSRLDIAVSIMPQALIRVAMGQANRYLIAAAWDSRWSVPHCLAPLRELPFD